MIILLCDIWLFFLLFLFTKIVDPTCHMKKNTVVVTTRYTIKPYELLFKQRITFFGALCRYEGRQSFVIMQKQAGFISKMCMKINF